MCNSFVCTSQWKETHHKLDPQSWFSIIPEENRGCIVRRELHISSSTLCWKWVCDNRENVYLSVRRYRKMGVSSSSLVSLLCTYALWVVIQISSHVWPLKLSTDSCEMLIIQQKWKRSFPIANSKIIFQNFSNWRRKSCLLFYGCSSPKRFHYLSWGNRK